MENDLTHMKEALILAQRAQAEGEVPVGAIIVHDGRVVGHGYNKRESAQNPIGHAEMIAIEAAAKTLGRWRLSGCTLYVTLEPCVMCAGAIVNSRIDRVVFGAEDPKGGGVTSLYNILQDTRLNHRPSVQKGVYALECSQILSDFFRARRTT